MLQHLMRMHNVEAGIRKLQGMHIANDKADIAQPLPTDFSPSQFKGCRRGFDRRYTTWRKSCCEVGGYGAPAPNQYRAN